ncbi:MAG: hypothetical protein QMC94_06015 [Anaerosomatales bacterium]|nr:hypothetical protein [Anaerosomatales bacterium]
MFIYFWICMALGLCAIMAGTGLLLTREHWMHRLDRRNANLSPELRRTILRYLTGGGASMIVAGVIVIAQAMYLLLSQDT